MEREEEEDAVRGVYIYIVYLYNRNEKKTTNYCFSRELAFYYVITPNEGKKKEDIEEALENESTARLMDARG